MDPKGPPRCTAGAATREGGGALHGDPHVPFTGDNPSRITTEIEDRGREYSDDEIYGSDEPSGTQF